jgi:hypothetical protein
VTVAEGFTLPKDTVNVCAGVVGTRESAAGSESVATDETATGPCEQSMNASGHVYVMSAVTITLVLSGLDSNVSCTVHGATTAAKYGSYVTLPFASA